MVQMKLAFLLTCLVSNVQCLIDFGNAIEERNSVLLGGYFGVHLRGQSGTHCGIIDEESGIYLVEAMRYAVDAINKRKDLVLSGLLGYRIVDTCSSIFKLRQDLPKMIARRNIAGIVGPATSDEAILASISFGIFNMGVISYSATSIDLADNAKYFNFFRSVPSDYVQVQALLDLLKHFKWTYVSTVNSDGNYGQRGMDRLIRTFSENGICISSRNVLPSAPLKEDFKTVVINLEKDPNAEVVVLFTTAEDTNRLLQAAGPKTRLTWLSSSAWSADMETVRNVNEAAKGAIIMNYENINSAEFFEHFKSLKLNKNRYKWFEEFWKITFSCDTINCTGNESLRGSDFYGKYAAAGAVIDAVNAYAYAMECVLRLDCPYTNISAKDCAWSSNFRYLTLLSIEQNVYCDKFYNKTIPFEKDRSFHRDIEIINFDGKAYKTVGKWAKDSKMLEIAEEKITWRGGVFPKSICSRPCNIGERKVISKTKECCFTCHACNNNEILVNNTCYTCAKFQLPDTNRTKCVELEKMTVDMKNSLSLIVLIESAVGIILNTIVLGLFIKHKDSKIVKSSSKELSFFMLVGLYLCFISPCIFLLNPTTIRCGLRRFIFGMSLTACYTPLMLKTIRIYRVFKAARFLGSMPFLVSPTSQIVVCFGLLALQLLLSIMWVVGDPPIVNHIFVEEFKMVADLCRADIITIAINLVPCFCMLAISTFYAFKSRKFPKNFNEAFNIGITMYISCVLWAIFIPALLMVKIESKNPFGTTYVISNFSNVIGLVSLAGLFWPKIRRLLWYGNEDQTNVIFTNGEKSNEFAASVDFKVNEAFDAEEKFERNCNEAMETVFGDNGRSNKKTRKSF